MVITANTRGGDPTGATSMTLLSVAAVILGGAAFSGGIVAPIGALFGTLTLVMVGTLLFAVRGQRRLPADGPGTDAAGRDRHPDPADLEDGEDVDLLRQVVSCEECAPHRAADAKHPGGEAVQSTAQEGCRGGSLKRPLTRMKTT
jgi:hypothetical protein